MGKQRSHAPATTSAASLYLVTFAAAALVRLAYLASIDDAPFFANLQTNGLRYHQWALLILDGPRTPTPPFDQPPGYAYFIAFIYSLFGRHVSAVAVVQALLDALTCTLIVNLSHNWFGLRSARIAAILAIACAPLIYFSAEILPATLSLALAVAATAAAAHGRWWGAGGLWAVALTVRSELLLAVPLLGLDAHRHLGTRALYRALAPIALLLVVFTSINFVASGHLVPLTIGSGVNLWLGNNPHADGVNPFLTGPLSGIAAEIRDATPHDTVLADRHFRQRAVDFWLQQPLAALALLGRKVAWTWTARELPNTSDIDWQTAQSWLYSLPILHPIFPIGFGVLAPLGLAGLILARHRWRELLPAATLLAAGIATNAIFFTNARFRLILLPPLICLAAHWLSQLNSHGRRIDKGSLAALAGGLLLAWGNFHGVRDYTITQITVNTAIIERESGDFAAAVGHLRQALAAQPDDDIAWIHLALALEQMGDVRSALEAYLDGLQRSPHSADLKGMTRRYLARQRIAPQLLDTYLASPQPTARAAAAATLRQSLGATRGVAP